MATERTLQALIRIWHELPALVGAEYAAIYPQLRDLLRQILDCEDSGERAWLVVDLLDVLAPYPETGRRIDETRQLPSEVRHGDRPGPTDPDPKWERDLLPGIRHRLAPRLTTRYTDVTAPHRLPREKRGVIAVGLTHQESSRSEHVEPLTLRLDQIIEVHLMVLSPGLEVEGEKVKQVVIEEGTDPEPIVFYVIGHQLGVMDLRIDFRQDGQAIASVAVAVEICAAEQPEEQVRIPPSALVPGGAYAPPTDLDFRVTLREDDGHTRFHYVLHSPTGAVDAWYVEIPGPRIVGSAESYRKKLLATLDRFAGSPVSRDQPLTADQIRRRLQAVGERLCDELLPDELRRRLRTIHKSPIHTLQITSDEPWIPWELLKPAADDPAEEAFWCERFELTRWLMGGPSPARELRIRRLACIEAAHAADKALEGAVQDRRYLARLSSEAGVDDRSLEGATLEQVEELLDRGDVDLWHFAAPGSVDPSDADAAAIHLMRQRVLLPTDLDRQRQDRIAAMRPLVFLNVAGAGQQSWALTGLAGWVRAWVRQGRCGVFVAPLGAVDDELAHLFSRTFYEALRCDQTVGRAILEARRAVKQKRPEDSTWLAYSVYAHPNARVVFSSQVCVPRTHPTCPHSKRVTSDESLKR